MRYLAIFLVVLAGVATGAVAYTNLTAGPPVVLAAPSHLVVAATGSAILPDGWTNAPSLTFQASAPDGTSARLDVEVQPKDTAFTGSPTATSASATARPAVTVHLPDGEYHWQMRLHSNNGVSPWVQQATPVNVDTRAPVVSTLTSSTDPNPAKTYHTSTAQFSWQASDGGSGVAGYSYRLDSAPRGNALAELRTTQPSVTLSGLTSGTWYMHVRALDHAGNWGPSRTYPIRIDVTPPGLAHVHFSQFQFDPQFDSLSVSFAVTRAATSVHVGLYRQTDDGLVRLYKLDGLSKGAKTTVTWNGKNSHGQLVPAGSYELYIRATDKYGHSSLTGWRDFLVDYRRIVVSLSQQRMTAYDGNHVVLTSLVTTGNRALPTPAGTYHIMARFHPFTFISPWKKGSPFYYPPSKVQWALLFREGGYFLHDAPWRSAFGPGTNSQLGTPGQNYTGTHGCVNVPTSTMQTLYSWARIGTVVQVVP
jgi:lipoprotein-anchoring transpeptidase ErfK/SrfK